MEFCLIGHLAYVEFLKVVSWDHSFNIFINELNFVARIASLRLYGGGTTIYSSATNTTALELSFNEDLRKLSTWFSSNYLTVNHTKTQAIILGNLNYEPVLSIDNSTVKIKSFLEILGVHIDNKLSFKAYISAILKKFYAKIQVLRRIKTLVPSDVALILYKTYLTPSGILQSTFVRDKQYFS